MKYSIVALTFVLVMGFLCQSGPAQPPGGFGGGGVGGPPGGFGGPPGGFSGGGYSRGGDRGSSGGFDPSSFLTRMDTNGNGMLDPDEAQGPARFMLDRMARNNPKIDITKPIPMSVLTESFQQMRSGGSSYGGSSYGGSSYGGSSDEETPILEKNSLVPGFAIVKVEKLPVPGFGASGEKFIVPVDERDLKEADDRMQRYDKNNDQHLDENELKEGRWSDSPMQYDKNKDGKLSRQELATRYARRRLVSGSQPESSQKRDEANAKRSRDNKDNRDQGEKEKPNPLEKRSSYRIVDVDGKPPLPAGLPEWFTKNDIDGDNQVSMAEHIKKWSQDEVEKFLTYDSNEDGLITTKECLAAIKKGLFMAGSSSGSTATASSSAASSSAAGTGAKTDEVSKTTGGAAPSADARMREWASYRLKKLDKDNNGFLSPEEFDNKDKFTKADVNKDGRIDVEEYANARKL